MGEVLGAAPMIREGGESLLHLFAHVRSEEEAWGAVEGLLEGAVALRVAAEASVDGGRHEVVPAAFDQLNETDQAQPGSVRDERQAEVAVKVPAHLALVAVDQAR